MDAVSDETAFQSLVRRLTVGPSIGDDRDGAARELLARYSARLTALARRRMSPRLLAKEDPEDVLQSVFRTFFRRLDAGEIELRGWASLWGLLALTTLRKCQTRAEWYRAAKRDVEREVSVRVSTGGAPCELVIPAREPSPGEAAAFAEEFERLLERLDGPDRGTVELMLAGASVAEAAEALGCSDRTIQRTLARVRQRYLDPRGEA